jgi:hypothetical protein
MKLWLLLVLSAVLALGVAVSAASAGEGSPPNPRKQCAKGRWQEWVKPDGTPLFRSENKCLNYVHSGGTLPLQTKSKSQLDCEALGGTFSTDPASNHVTPNGTFLWSCNNGPFQAFSGAIFGDCITDAGAGNAALMAFSVSAPFDSSCFRA